ncbi:GL22409 [Drosophila persimilis]|uniref:GL22409 n=1 Tax=Drosophila persimilis TaxID=7234 RepID=B4HD32_DROPE|nr:GL22409 [Drosophila persimilis]
MLLGFVNALVSVESALPRRLAPSSRDLDSPKANQAKQTEFVSKIRQSQRRLARGRPLAWPITLYGIHQQQQHSSGKQGAKPAAPARAAAATPNTRRPLYSRGAQANPAENHLTKVQQKLTDEQEKQQKQPLNIQQQQKRDHNLGRQHQQQHQHRSHQSQPQAKGRQCQRDQQMQPTQNRVQTPRNPQQQQQLAVQCDGKCVEMLKEYAVKIENLEKRLQELTTLITVANPPTQTPAAAAAPTPPRPAANTQPDAAAVSEDSDIDCEALSDDGDDQWTDHDSFEDEMTEEIMDAYGSFYSDNVYW